MDEFRYREFDKSGKTEKWRKLKKKCHQMCKSAKQNFADQFITDLKDRDPKTWMTSMKKLGRPNHERDNDTWHFEN